MRTLLLMGRRVSAPSLDLSTGGTFARALAAYQYTQAPTDGSSAFLQSVASGTRRSADTRGDGIGASLLMEKTATNYIPYSREMSNAAWTNAADVAADQNGGPLADGGADRINHVANAFGPRPNTPTASPGPAGAVTGSVWCRAVSGTGTQQFYCYHNNASAGLVAHVQSTTTTYVRHGWTGAATTNSGAFVADGRDLAGISGGTSAHAEDHYFDLVQLEAGYYPTSPIVTAGTSVTRPADTLSYASGAYPAGFLTNGVVIVFAPDASSAEIVSATEKWTLLSNGPNGISGLGIEDAVRIRENGGVCVVELVQAHTVRATLTVTFSRGQALTITAKPSAGSITVSGATTGNGTNTGTGGAWTSGQTIYVGGDSAALNSVTGRYVGAVITEAV